MNREQPHGVSEAKLPPQPMTEEIIDHHRKAAEHRAQAGYHSQEAANHYTSGNHEKARHHAHLALGHHVHATYHAEAAKYSAEEDGSY